MSSVFTIPQVGEELKRVGHNNKVFITRLFRPWFILENMEKQMTDLSIEISAKLPNEDWKNAFKANALFSRHHRQAP